MGYIATKKYRQGLRLSKRLAEASELSGADGRSALLGALNIGGNSPRADDVREFVKGRKVNLRVLPPSGSYSGHRIQGECPECKRWVSMGRMHQHVWAHARPAAELAILTCLEASLDEQSGHIESAAYHAPSECNGDITRSMVKYVREELDRLEVTETQVESALEALSDEDAKRLSSEAWANVGQNNPFLNPTCEHGRKMTDGCVPCDEAYERECGQFVDPPDSGPRMTERDEVKVAAGSMIRHRSFVITVEGEGERARVRTNHGVWDSLRTGIRYQLQESDYAPLNGCVRRFYAVGLVDVWNTLDGWRRQHNVTLSESEDAR